MFRQFAAVLALAVPLAAFANATVEGLKGTAQAGSEPAFVGQVIFSGSQITTGPNSSLVLAFADGGRMILEQNTTFRLVSFDYTPNVPKQDHAVFDLMKGALRVITGALHKRNPYLFALRTPQVNIGVRGTDFMVSVVNPGYISVISGEIAVSNGAGTVVLGPGSLVTVASNAVLATPIATSALPAATSSAFASMGSVTMTAGGAAGGAVAGTAATSGTGFGAAAGLIAVGAGVAGVAALNKDEVESPSTTTHH